MTSKNYGWTPERLSSLDGKTYVITGATSGAGFHATRTLLSKGVRVIMLNRNAEKSEATLASLRQEFGDQAAVEFVQMDLASFASVREAAAQVLDKTPRIDALLCNAALGQIATQQLTVDGHESQFGVNYLGHFLLCGLLFDRIEASTGRVVVVGSNGYKMGPKTIQFDNLNYDTGYSSWTAYAHSKMAQMMFAYELQRRVKTAGKDVQVQVCHPGASQTDLIRDNADKTIKFIWSLIKPLAQSAEHGAWPEVMCATADGLKPQAYYGPTKWGEMRGAIGECKLEPFVLDQEEAARLWAVSEELTGLNWTIG